jgi:hypothetical protein
MSRRCDAHRGCASGRNRLTGCARWRPREFAARVTSAMRPCQTVVTPTTRQHARSEGSSPGDRDPTSPRAAAQRASAMPSDDFDEAALKEVLGDPEESIELEGSIVGSEDFGSRPGTAQKAPTKQPSKAPTRASSALKGSGESGLFSQASEDFPSTRPGTGAAPGTLPPPTASKTPSRRGGGAPEGASTPLLSPEPSGLRKEPSGMGKGAPSGLGTQPPGPFASRTAPSTRPPSSQG